MDEIPVFPDGHDADEEGIEADAKVNELKRQIDSNAYDVDAPAVAEAILRKIRLLRQVRAIAGANGAGRIPPGLGDLQNP
jgi:hypothetical protein